MNNSIRPSLFFLYLFSGCAIINKSSLHPMFPMYCDWTGGADVVRCECTKEELLGVWECNFSYGKTGTLLVRFEKNNEVTVCIREYRELEENGRIPVSHEFERDFYLIDCNTIYFAGIAHGTRLGTMAKFEIVGDKITLETNYYSSITQTQLRRVPSERFDEMINEERKIAQIKRKQIRELYAPKHVRKAEK